MTTWPIMAGVMIMRLTGAGGAPTRKSARRCSGGRSSAGAASDAGYRWFQGGVGYRGLALASSSGQTIMRLPSCHWSITALCAV